MLDVEQQTIYAHILAFMSLKKESMLCLPQRGKAVVSPRINHLFQRGMVLWECLADCHESGCHSPHYSCTSPMDYNSHHSLHYDTHIPIHHCTNHTAVTIHSLTLIVSPHLNLIHTHTYKQHTSLHSPRSLVLPRLTFWVFPLYSVSLCLPGLPIHSDRLLPAFWPCLL